MTDANSSDPGADLRQIIKSYRELSRERYLSGLRMKELLALAEARGYDSEAIKVIAKLEGGAPDWAALHARGLTAAEAAKEAGRSESAARAWSGHHGKRWAAQKPGRKSLDWASFYARGLTASEAAKAAGVGIQSAYAWAKKNGVKWEKASINTNTVQAYKSALGIG